MTRPIEAGDPAPPFTVPSTRGDVSLSDLLSEGKAVLVFYTEDDSEVLIVRILHAGMDPLRHL